MIRASTRTFSLTLDDGTEVHGSIAIGDTDIAELTKRFEQRVLVHAMAVFRPSGRLLRLDLEHIEDGSHAPGMWSRLPGPGPEAGLPHRSEPEDRPRGVAAFFGTWPGDETEAELVEALAELA